MRKLLVDTCAIVWLATGDRKLSQFARDAMRDAELLCFSSISIWEIARLVKTGDLEIPVSPQRLAKAALIAGAFDERFYAVVPNQTGGGGCPLLKRNYGENVEALMRNFPHWFCSDFGKYAGREKEMPFDSHLLMACVAPRKLLVEGFDDPFYDTEGEFEALKAASSVWTFLGRSGLPRSTWPVAYDVSAIGSDIGYVRRSERHGLSAHDWTWIMDFASDKW